MAIMTTAEELRECEEILRKAQALPSPAWVVDVVQREVDTLRARLAEESAR